MATALPPPNTKETFDHKPFDLSGIPLFLCALLAFREVTETPNLFSNTSPTARGEGGFALALRHFPGSLGILGGLQLLSLHAGKGVILPHMGGP